MTGQNLSEIRAARSAVCAFSPIFSDVAEPSLSPSYIRRDGYFRTEALKPGLPTANIRVVGCLIPQRPWNSCPDFCPY
jgi:hypothetical protein